MDKETAKHYPDFHFHITIKSVSFAALVGFSGYSYFIDDNSGKEVHRYDSKLITEIDARVRTLEVSMESFTAHLAEDNLELIEKDD